MKEIAFSDEEVMDIQGHYKVELAKVEKRMEQLQTTIDKLKASLNEPEPEPSEI